MAMETRKAIAPHGTATSDDAWDGPKAKANLKSDRDAAYYRRAFAWMDPEGDESAKSTYKFIHHFVASDGDIGAASTRGCSAGIAVLNGGRGGTTIPTEDRKGVWRHLARHLEDADMEPPELKSFREISRTCFASEIRVEQRAAEDQAPVIKGYAARFDKPSAGLPWKERVKKGAFSKSIREHDVRALWNHNTDFPLGRTKSETLRLEEDEKGLRAEIDPPDTQIGRDAVTSIKRGDVTGMSFGFEVVRDEWNEKFTERTLLEVKLFEVSPVTFPAYPSTSVDVRGRIENMGLDFDAEDLTYLLFRVGRGTALSVADRETLDSLVCLRDYYRAGFTPIPIVEPIEDHSADARGEPAMSHLLRARMRATESILRGVI